MVFRGEATVALDELLTLFFCPFFYNRRKSRQQVVSNARGSFCWDILHFVVA
jgi:hypothetical protein